MPEAPIAELGFKRHLKVELFPTIWCPGCGIGTIMMQLAMVLDEMGLDDRNTVIVTGIGCTGRMGSYLRHESVYTLHGRTLPVAEAIKTVRPELQVIVVAGDGDTASIGGNHLLHAIRRNAPVTVLCNNNEIYGLTGGQTGPTTPTGTKTLSSPGGNPNTPINLQAIVRSSAHAVYAKTTVYHQLHMRNVIREAIQHDGFSLVDITSQCIENNGRRIGFASANEMLGFYRKTYKRAPRDADHLNPFEIGILYPQTNGAASNGNGATSVPAALPAQPRTHIASASDSPGAGGATARMPVADDEKARRRAESQRRLALMSQLSSEVKMRVARGELPLADALRAAGLEVPPEVAATARTGASAPEGAPQPASRLEVSASGEDPGTETRRTELDAQRGEQEAEAAGPPADALPAAMPADPGQRRREEALRRAALMARLPPDVKLRVARGELDLSDALREAGIDPGQIGQ